MYSKAASRGAWFVSLVALVWGRWECDLRIGGGFLDSRFETWWLSRDWCGGEVVGECVVVVVVVVGRAESRVLILTLYRPTAGCQLAVVSFACSHVSHYLD